MKLNVGCGEFYAEGWVNIDTYDGEEVKVDQVADATLLPFKNGEADKVYAGHVLEHLPEPFGVLEALVEFRRVLRPNGLLLVVGPDVRRGRKMLKDGLISEEQYDEILNSSGRWPGDDHLWPCHEERLLDFVKQVFDDAYGLPIGAAPMDWPIVSRVGWQCAVIARKNR